MTAKIKYFLPAREIAFALETTSKLEGHKLMDGAFMSKKVVWRCAGLEKVLL